MSIAINLAGMLRLYREVTYPLILDVLSECHCIWRSSQAVLLDTRDFEDLSSGYRLPVVFSDKDITVLLPLSRAGLHFQYPAG
jgi:hypothetical protein